MGVCTYTHKAIHDQRKLFLYDMLFLESLVTRLSYFVGCELRYEYDVLMHSKHTTHFLYDYNILVSST